MKIKKHDTFYQHRKDRRLAPILLEVQKVIEDREGYRGIYQVRWHILDTKRVHTSEFPMAECKGKLDCFEPIPREVYLRAVAIMKEASSYKSARRRILYLMRKNGF